MRWCLSASLSTRRKFHIQQQYAVFVTILVTVVSSLLSSSSTFGRVRGAATAFIPQLWSTTCRSLQLQSKERRQQQQAGTQHRHPGIALLPVSPVRGIIVRFATTCSSSRSSSATTHAGESSFGWREMMMMDGKGQTTTTATTVVDDASSSSLSFQKNRAAPLLVVCSKCHGEGLLRKPPSRKARLRHKRQQQQQQQQSSAANEPLSLSNTSSTTRKDNDDDKNKKPLHLIPPRIDPCPRCHATGLVEIQLRGSSSSTVDMTINHDEPQTSATTTNIKNQQQQHLFHQSPRQQLSSLSLPTVAIVGGGLAGLALAIACGHRGIPATVYERDENFGQRRQGYGLTLQQASKALASLGMSASTISNADHHPANNSSRDWITSTRHLVHKPDGTVVGEWGLRKWKQQSTLLSSSSEQVEEEEDKEEEKAESAPCGQRQQGKQQYQQPKNGRGKRRQNVHIARQALRYQLLMAAYDAARSFAFQTKASTMSKNSDDHDDDTLALFEPKDGGIDDAPSSSVVQWNHKFLQYTKTESGRLELLFQVEDNSNGENNKQQEVRVEADLLVGADGIRSQVRRQLYVDTEVAPLRYLNCLVILGICPLSSITAIQPLPTEKNTNHVNFLLDGHTVFQTADGTTRIYVMPYSETECMWQLSFPMPSEDEAMSLSIDGGPTALLQQAMERCQTWHAPIPQILKATPVSLVSGYPVYDRQPLDTLDIGDKSCSNNKDYQEGHRRVTLIGDACHPMSPFKGQGANQALLDALSLANSIYTTYVNTDKKNMNTNHHDMEPEANNRFRHDELLKEALSRFEEEMLSRSTVKVEASAEAAQFLHTEVAIQEGDVTRGAAAAVNKKRRSTNNE